MMLSGPFVLGNARYPFPNVLQEGEHSLPVGTPTLQCLLELYMLLSLLFSPCLPDFSPGKGLFPSVHCAFSLSQVTSPDLASATFSLQMCSFLNPQIDFLVVQNDLMLI